MEILSFLKEVSSVFEKCQFLVSFSFIKKKTFYAKSISFWANWISKYSDKIMSCKLWGKGTSVSVNINFCKNVNFLRKKLKFWEKVTFSLSCTTMLISRKMWFLVWRFIYINKVSNSDKILQFLRYVNLYMY